jgi:HK97 gp10 family phage protein
MEVSVDVSGVQEVQTALLNFDEAMQRRVHEQLGEWCELVKQAAQNMAPVRTGYLRSTIYARMVDYWALEIGVEAFYGYFIEVGTQFMKAQPFMYPALQEYLPILEPVLIAAINQAKSEAGL